MRARKSKRRRCDSEQLKNGVKCPVNLDGPHGAGLAKGVVFCPTDRMKMPFLHAMILLPCQIVRTARRIIYRILGYNGGWLTSSPRGKDYSVLLADWSQSLLGEVSPEEQELSCARRVPETAHVLHWVSSQVF
jgi:hypothetical protein